MYKNGRRIVYVCINVCVYVLMLVHTCMYVGETLYICVCMYEYFYHVMYVLCKPIIGGL